MAELAKHFFRSQVFAFAIYLVLSSSALAAGPTLVVTQLDGSQFRGELNAWTAEEIVVQTEQETVTIASPQLLRVEWQHDSPSRKTQETFLELVDGTRLPHQGYEVNKGQATIATSLAGKQPLTLSTDRIAYVQLAIDAPGRKETVANQNGDVLIVRKKKTGNFDTLTGILGEVTLKQVEFTWDGEAIPVKLSKVAAMAYFHARSPATKDPICWLNLRGGAKLPVETLSLAGQKVEVKTISGLSFSVSQEWLQDADFSQGKLAYLSDLQPVEQHWTPRIGLPKSADLIRQHGLPRRDQSFTGSVLALRWPSAKTASVEEQTKTFSKGLALRSRTEIRYRLPQGMRRFITLAGIDPETANQGNVTLEIFAGRRSVWQGEIDGNTAPTEIDVPLGNARELRLVVDYGKNLDFGDRLHLIEARLSQ